MSWDDKLISIFTPFLHSFDQSGMTSWPMLRLSPQLYSLFSIYLSYKRTFLMGKNLSHLYNLVSD